MKKVQIAHYIAKGDIYSKLIRWWEYFSPVDRLLFLFGKRLPSFKHADSSHTEIVFTKKNVEQWWSSSPRDGGVRVKHITPREGNWSYHNLMLTDEQFMLLEIFLNRHEGKGYDKTGIALSQIIPIGISKQEKFFCSEFVVTALDFCGYLSADKHFDWYSPSRLKALLVYLTLK